MFATWTLARRLRAALGAFGLLLVLAIIAIIAALSQADQAVADQTGRIFPARVAASQLLTSLVDQETALRGFAITSDASYLTPYHQGITDQQAIRSRLERFVGPRDSSRIALLTVDAAITAWQQEYAELRLLDVQNGGGRTTIGFGKQLFERVRETSQVLDRQLAREVRVAQAEADRDRQLVLVVLGVIVLAVSLGLVALQRALGSLVVQPMRDLATQVAVVSTGRHEVAIAPAGPPDLQAMGAGVESMRQELVRALAEVEAQQRDLERRAAELARSNADLEQFAYVASHDLQEPLRKVASFCQLIEQRYGGQLDERGEQYIAFAVDGAKRMQRLITDLLTFSRVGRTSEGFRRVPLTQVIDKAWDSLDARALASGGELAVAFQDEQVWGDPALLQLLLTNLLGNALKYRRDDASPKVRISAHREGAMLRLDVADNGIGISPEYAEKVFVIFQRLHGRDEYEGTGIGLALCKKVVEFHGGQIELRPSALGGVCVSFTLPLEESSADV